MSDQPNDTLPSTPSSPDLQVASHENDSKNGDSLSQADASGRDQPDWQTHFSRALSTQLYEKFKDMKKSGMWTKIDPLGDVVKSCLWESIVTASIGQEDPSEATDENKPSDSDEKLTRLGQIALDRAKELLCKDDTFSGLQTPASTGPHALFKHAKSHLEDRISAFHRSAHYFLGYQEYTKKISEGSDAKPFSLWSSEQQALDKAKKAAAAAEEAAKRRAKAEEDGADWMGLLSGDGPFHY